MSEALCSECGEPAELGDLCRSCAADQPTETPGNTPTRKAPDRPSSGPSSPPPEDDPVVGEVLGGSRIEGRLGEGGMGVVYDAVHEVLEKPVVVKILPPACSHDEELRDRFLLEARATARLDHPHVVRVHDAGYEKGYLFYVMQRVEGESLEDLCQREGPLDPVRATAICRKAAEGLAAAHAEGIIHRDVKPANILLGSDGQVKVSDFGLARDLAREGMSASGQVLGTPHYMAPEQADGEADVRSDLYSLGVSLYRALTDRVPFEGSSWWRIMKAHMTEPPPDPRDLRPELPDALGRVLDRLLAKDPHDRYPDAETLAADLRRIEEALGEASDPSIQLAVGRRRGPRPPWLVALVAVPLLLIGWVAWRTVRPATPESPDPPPPVDARLDLELDGPWAHPDRRDGVLLAGQLAFRGRVRGASPDALQLVVGGATVPLADDGSFEREVSGLAEGTRTFGVRLQDEMGRAVDERAVEVRVLPPPTFRIAGWGDDRPWTYADEIELELRLQDPYPERYDLEAGVGRLERAADGPATLHLEAPLDPGSNLLPVSVTVDGIPLATFTIWATRLEVPRPVVTAPTDETWVRGPAITVEGRLEGEVRGDLSLAAGDAETTPASDGTFVLEPEVPAGETTPTLPLRLVREGRELGRWQVPVRVDHEPPRLLDVRPVDGTRRSAEVLEDGLRVAARVRDESGVTVSCGEVELTSSDGGSFAGRIDAEAGWNRLTFRATDAVGRTTTVERSVLVVPPGMVYVPGGPVRIDPDAGGPPVEVEPFFIDRTEVRRGDYARFLEETPSHPPPSQWEELRSPDGWEDLPMSFVSFHDARAYARWRGARLPTRAEWVRAAAWDPETESLRTYPWGDRPPSELDPLPCRANVPSGEPVGVFSYDPEGASGLGCLNMAGNVAEWVEGEPPPGRSRDDAVVRALLGGGYTTQNLDLNLRCTRTVWQRATTRYAHTGFRCARPVEGSP